MTLSASKGKLKIIAAATKKAASSNVLISFNCGGDQSHVSAMKHKSSLRSTTGLHESACFAALLCVVKARLGVSAIDMQKASTMFVVGHVRNGRASIAIGTYPNRSAIRKALNGFVSALAIPKIYAAYSRLIKNVGEPANREYFNHSMSSMLSSIERADILVTGKVSVTSDTLKDIVAGVKWDKIPSISDKKTSPKVEKAVANEDHDKTIKVDLPRGLGVYILSSLLMKRLPGASFCYSGKSMYISVSQSQLEAAGNVERASEYAKKLHDFVKKHGIEPIIHIAASKACCDAAELITDADKSWSESALKFSV